MGSELQCTTVWILVTDMDDDSDSEEWSVDTSEEAVMKRQRELRLLSDRIPTPALRLADVMGFHRLSDLLDLPMSDLKRLCAEAGADTSQFVFEDDEDEFVDALLPFCEAGKRVMCSRFRRNMEAAATMPFGLVFLDVDGVLNKKGHTVDQKLDAENLDQLAKLINSPSAPRVVLSTSWRSCLRQKSELWDAMLDAGVPEGSIVGQPDVMADITQRAAEICKWIDSAKGLAGWTGAYVVLDDMDLTKDGKDQSLDGHFVRVSDEFGLCEGNVREAMAILGVSQGS